MINDNGDIYLSYEAPPETSEDLNFVASFPEPAYDPGYADSTYTDIYSPYYNPVSDQMEYPPKSIIVGEAPQKKAEEGILDIFGKILNIAGKTYSQIATTKKFQDYKTVPPFQTGMPKEIFYPLQRKSQTGLDTGILTTPSKGIISGIPNIYLLFAVGLILLITMGKS